jgi:hypothetical protein
VFQKHRIGSKVVVIEQSDETGIMVEADDNLQKHIITTVENGILVISCDEYFINTEVMKVTVKMPVGSNSETDLQLLVRTP